jgi:hypothetical protein
MKLHILAARVLFVSAYVVFGIVIFAAAATILLKAVITARARAKIEPAKVFAGYVLDPIPESVTNIKADRPQAYGGYMYTLRFNINRADLALLIDSGPLQKVWSAKYDHDHGWVSWDWDRPGPLGMPKRPISITVYGSSGGRPREPAWFRPELWDDPEAYAFRKEVGGQNITKVLLYNDKEGEAYFIVSRFRL